MSFNLPIPLIDYLDQEAKRQFPQLNRTQILRKIIWFYTENKSKLTELKRLNIALIQKLRSIFDSLIFHTDKPDINSKQKLYKIKDIADNIPYGFEERGILSGVNLLNPPTSIEDIINKLLENLRKKQS